MTKIEVKRGSWRPIEAEDTERIKEGVAKMRQALEEDEKRERERGSGLPWDWRNRVLRVVSPATGEAVIPMHYGLPPGASQHMM